MVEVSFTRSRSRRIDQSGRTARTDTAPSSGAKLPFVAGQALQPERQDAATSAELECLYRSLCEATETVNPRTFRLLQSGNRKIAQKLIEEAGEVAIEAVRHRTKSTVRESADLLYHLVVLWRRAGVRPADVWLEMRSRAERFGLAEKLPKPHDD